MIHLIFSVSHLIAQFVVQHFGATHTVVRHSAGACDIIRMYVDC